MLAGGRAVAPGQLEDGDGRRGRGPADRGEQRASLSGAKARRKQDDFAVGQGPRSLGRRGSIAGAVAKALEQKGQRLADHAAPTHDPDARAHPRPAWHCLAPTLSFPLLKPVLRTHRRARICQVAYLARTPARISREQPRGVGPAKGREGRASPRVTARTAAWVRSDTPSFPRMRSTWTFTVPTLTKRCVAIWRLVSPCARSCSTSASRVVSGVIGGSSGCWASSVRRCSRRVASSGLSSASPRSTWRTAPTT